MQVQLAREHVKCKYMCAMETCRAKERYTRARTREVRLGRRRPFFYVSGLWARPEASRERVERQSSVKSERIDGHEGIFAGIDATKRGEALKECAQW